MVYMGWLDKDGYGRLSYRRHGVVTGSIVHRVVYRATKGDIPDGMQIDHICRVRCCVNPGHLRVATPLQNTRNSARVETTHCKRGHPLSGENLYQRPGSGRRYCLACKRQRLDSA